MIGGFQPNAFQGLGKFAFQIAPSVATESPSPTSSGSPGSRRPWGSYAHREPWETVRKITTNNDERDILEIMAIWMRTKH